MDYNLRRLKIIIINNNNNNNNNTNTACIRRGNFTADMPKMYAHSTIWARGLLAV